MTNRRLPIIGCRLSPLAVATAILAPATVVAPVAAQAQQAIYPIVVEQGADPLLQNLAIPANAASAGMWSRKVAWPIIAIHSSVLPDGRILAFGTPPGGTVQDGRKLVFWDPRKGIDGAALTIVPNAQNVDSFCGTATLLSDGNLLTSGGASYSSGYSSRESMVLDWRSSTAKRDFDLTAQRWYGTMTKLADGRAVITGGGAPYANGDPNRPDAANDISSTPEVYTPGQGWRSLMGAYSTDAFGAKNTRWWYPRQWVSPTGSLFGISTEKMWEMKLDGNGSIRTLGNFKTAPDNTSRPNTGPTSTAVMYDAGKILQVGGNGYNPGWQSPSSALATVIDINAIGSGRVTISETAPMAFPRQWANALVLPTGRVLVTGGSRWGDEPGTNDANTVFAAETWDPATGRWTTGASNGTFRGYHSISTLLPNGAVLVAGGGAAGRPDHPDAEIYYPAYLFTANGNGSVLAARPRIVSLSTNASTYNQSIDVQTASGDDVRQVSLIAVGSVTHSFDSNQRRMTLPFTRTANGLKVAMPPSANLAPPGYYLLSTVNAAGVPSAGTIIAIGAAAPAKPSETGRVPQPTRTLVEGSAIKMDTPNWPGYFLRHTNYEGWVSKIDTDSAPSARMDAAFIVRKGRADANCYSFESANFPGKFLQHYWFQTFLRGDNDEGGRRAQTFCARPALNGSTDANDISFEALTHPGYYLRHNNFRVKLMENTSAPADGTWRVSGAGVVPGSDVALESASFPGYLIRHRNYLGYISQIGANSSVSEKLDARFVVRPGLADSNCVSLESKYFAGYYLRHQNFEVKLLPRDSRSDRDATFCPRRALNGSSDIGAVSLESLSWPGYFIRHGDFRLYIAKDDGSRFHKPDSSYVAKPPIE